MIGQDTHATRLYWLLENTAAANGLCDPMQRNVYVRHDIV